MEDLAQELLSVMQPLIESHAKKGLSVDSLIEAIKIASIGSVETVYSTEDQEKVKSFYKADDSTTINKPKKLTRGYVDGCFDIMHSGHYNALRQAKALCDVLVVGVHSDAEIIRNKGPPVMNDEERLAAAKACKWADEVVFDTPYDPNIELLDRLNCDFGIHGDDLPTKADGTVAYQDLKEAGRFKVIKRTEGVSTTDLVGRLLLMTKDHHQHSNNIPSSVKSPTLSSAQTLPLIDMNFSLDSNTLLTPSTSSSASNNITASPMKTTRTTRTASTTENNEHYTKGLTGFLPTTWRIVQFSNMKKPTPDDKIVYIDGAFDLFHVGHIETLKKAKELGTFLYVGIHDDSTVNKYKGKNYPIMNLHERVLNVLSCKYVDEVVIGAPLKITKDLLTVLNVNVVASGKNTKLIHDEQNALKPDEDPYELPKSLGIYQEVVTDKVMDTEVVVNRIIENRLKYENRNKSRSAKELDYLSTRQTMQEI